MWKDPVRGRCSDPLERRLGPGSGDTNRGGKKVTISELFGMYGEDIVMNWFCGLRQRE